MDMDAMDMDMDMLHSSAHIHVRCCFGSTTPELPGRAGSSHGPPYWSPGLRTTHAPVSVLRSDVIRRLSELPSFVHRPHYRRVGLIRLSFGHHVIRRLSKLEF